MKRQRSEEEKAWLLSPAAVSLRAHYSAQAKLSANALMSAGMTSTDPACRMHATSYATWLAALKELDPTHEPD